LNLRTDCHINALYLITFFVDSKSPYGINHLLFLNFAAYEDERYV
jgi:hypothetical protein